MVGSQLASRVVYSRAGPRRHLTAGLCGVTFFIALLALLGPDTSLWWARLILFGMGFSMSQVFVPAQAASFATISHADTGRASTLYNASRQLGGALGVALLTSVIVFVGPVHIVNGHATANFAAYRVTFLVAAAAALLGVFSSVMIHDSDAAQTMVDPRERKRGVTAAPVADPVAAPATAGPPPAAEPAVRTLSPPAGSSRGGGCLRSRCPRSSARRRR